MKKVLVVGDSILDHYVYGSVSRVNPEAPHSVVLDASEKTEIRLGGACNVAANIRSLSLATDNVVIHYWGPYDDTVEELLGMLQISVSPWMYHDKILTKTRYVAGNHHLLRVDHGKRYSFRFPDHINVEEFKKKLKQFDYDLIVVSDYDKGVVTPSISGAAMEFGKKVIVDLKKLKNVHLSGPKKEHVFIKCNSAEFESEITHDVISAVGSVIKTKGENGFEVFSNNLSVVSLGAASDGRPVDVVGAGDVFLAGMAAEYLSSADWNSVDMAKFGNVCASKKVQHFGTYIVKRGDL